MTKAKSSQTFWFLALPILVGLGIAFAVPTFARAQQHMVRESLLVPAVRESSWNVDQLTIDGANKATFTNATAAAVTFTLDVAASNVLSDVILSSVAWGDYDNDGDLDVLLTGRGTGLIPLSSVYENTGSGLAEDVSISGVLEDVYWSSAAWGDYDNDGDLDILLTGYDGSGNHSRVYKNTGSGFMEDVSISSVLVDVSNSSVAWGDYDNDGDLDILLTGSDSGSNRLSKLYENTGTGFKEDLAASSVLTGVSNSSVAWGDYDNDGDLDILLTGYDGSIRRSYVYENTGSGFTENVSISSVLPGVNGSSAAWGDYDNDGDLDILLTGYGEGIGPLSRLYENTGSGFTEDLAASSVLTDVINGSAAWGDYDNDGDLDILLTGDTWIKGVNNGVSRLYENTGSGFTENITASSILTGVYYSSVAWGDYDNDGDLDILLTGHDGDGFQSNVYRNNVVTNNIPPGAPGGLKSSMDGQQVSLSWDPPSPLTYTTPFTSLTYNLRVGTASGLSDILAPMSCVGTCGTGPDGYRQVPAMGAANHGLSATLNLPPGTYYWSVQAIDHTFTGSPWAVEGVFPSQEVNLPVVYR